MVRKGAWSHEEDLLLRKCIEEYGEGKWYQVPVRAGLNRCRKSCRLRWLNYLHPDVKRGEFSDDEIDLILRLHKLLGNRWSLIAGRLPGRTANDVKNYWNSHLHKRPEFRLPRLRQDEVVRPQVLSFKGKGISHGLLVANQLPLPELLLHQHEDSASWWSELLDNVNLDEEFCNTDMNDGPSTSSFRMDIKKIEVEKSLLLDNCSMLLDDFLDINFETTDK